MASCWQPAQLMVLKNNRKDEISEFWFLNDNIHKVVWVNMQWWAWTKLVLKHISHPTHLTLLLKGYLTHWLSTYHTLIHIQENNLLLLKGYLTHYWHKWKIYLVRFMFFKGHRPLWIWLRWKGIFSDTLFWSETACCNVWSQWWGKYSHFLCRSCSMHNSSTPIVPWHSAQGTSPIFLRMPWPPISPTLDFCM